MSSRFVRTSKYRHVFGTPAKKGACYDNLKLSRNAVDGNLIKVNPKFLSVNWAASGGGAFAIIPLERVGKLPNDFPLVTGHTASVLDTDFSPFNDHVVASASEDAKIMIWNIPEGGLKTSLTTPSVMLSGHSRKVNAVLFHPTAENVLASSSADVLIKLWDIEKGMERVCLPEHPDAIHSICWNYNGSLMATSCKDKKIRVLDVRAGQIVQTGDGHSGIKGTRVIWLGDSSRLMTTGFGRTSDRQVSIWDTSNMTTSLKTENIDATSGSFMPFYDADTRIIFLAGKGDGNIRYFEMVDEEPYMHFLSDYKSNEPQRGMAFMPKRAVNVMETEIARAYKVTTTTIEPISFTVPRKSDTFQADLYPDTIGPEAPMTAAGFFHGQDANPILISLEKGFVPPEYREFVASPVFARFASPSPPGPSSAVFDTVSVSSSSATASKEFEEMQCRLEAIRRENEALKQRMMEQDEKTEALEKQFAELSSIRDDLNDLKGRTTPSLDKEDE